MSYLLEFENWDKWSAEPLPNAGDKIQCPECKEWSAVERWEESSVGCEDCGEHLAIECPECGYLIDFIFANLLETQRTPASREANGGNV